MATHKASLLDVVFNTLIIGSEVLFV